MTKLKVNAARRLHSILERAQSGNGNLESGKVWCLASGIRLDGLSESQQLTIALGVVANLRNLIDEVEDGLKQHASTTKYEACFARIRQYIIGATIQAAWSGVTGQIYVGETLALLDLMADVLPSEGDEIPEQDILNLLSEIEALKKMFDESALPPFHSHYAKILLNRLKAALLDYAFFGLRGVRESIQQVQGVFFEMKANEAELAAEAATMSGEQNTFFSKLCAVGNEVAEVSKKAYYIGNVAAAVGKGAEKFVLPWLKS